MYFLNIRMFKVTAYRVTLKRRHEIMRNVKVMSYMFPPILIHTFIAPIGSLISIIGFFHQLPVIPYCVFHMFYNLPQLIIMLRHIFLSIRRRNTQIANTETLVKTVFGKGLPAKFTTELYFISLKRQWN
uniref:G protein-coupled receptor n=1 Tax=Panagrolaimus sp. PS1159 TaxID=55785 RepID=A0AC35G919_9BILA